MSFPDATIALTATRFTDRLNRRGGQEPNGRHAIRRARVRACIRAGSGGGSRAIPTDAIDRVEQERVIVIADDSSACAEFVGHAGRTSYRIKRGRPGSCGIGGATGCHLVIRTLETAHDRLQFDGCCGEPSTRRIQVIGDLARGAKHRDRALKEGRRRSLPSRCRRSAIGSGPG